MSSPGTDSSGVHRTFYLNNNHPVRIMHPMPDEMRSRLAALGETIGDDHFQFLADISLNVPFTDPTTWKGIAKRSKNFKLVFLQITEVL